MRQLWLPGIPSLELSGSNGTRWSQGHVVASAPVREPLGGVRAATRGRPPPPSASELAELDELIERLEWAADGGHGAVCSVWARDDVPTLDLEWLLNGALLEVMAAVTLLPREARRESLEQSENSPEVAE